MASFLERYLGLGLSQGSAARYQSAPDRRALEMPGALRFVFVVLCFQVAEFSDACIIELECPECIPEYMPAVVAPRAAGGRVVAAEGAEVALACGGGKFLAYPLLGALVAVCEAGRYRVRADGALRHLLDLGCQEDSFEDVLHEVERCAPPLQGRAYRERRAGAAPRHLATLCYDPQRALAVRLRTNSARELALPPHADAAGPLSLFGNIGHMLDAATRLDAERLYGDDARLDRRLRELLEPERFTLAAQTLTSARLLSARYFDARSARVTEFASNRVAAWRSVVEGNLRLLHEDVARRLRGAAPLDVYAGTHGVLALDTGAPRAELFLRAGGRFPVPRYIWTVLFSRDLNRGVALVLLNDPFVTVSEIREAVLCASACGALSWLAELQWHRNYERPLNGLVFCCNLREFADAVPEMPRVFNDTVELLV